MYIYTGGEPTVRKKDLIKLCEMHPDCEFLSFSNGTLFDEEFCDEILRVKNFVPAFSLEGSEEANDGRRGEGIYREGYACNETVERTRGSSIWSFHLLYRHERRQCKQ
mgnify:CR=1 FL=1